MALPEILSQEEINALLAAIAAEEEQGEAERPKDPFRPRELRPEGKGRVKPYDFARPNKLSKEQLRTLQVMHEPFARGIATTMSAYLRSFVQVEVVSADAMTYEEFSRMLPNPGMMAVFSLGPLEGSALLEIDPDLGFAILDRLLGGPGTAPKHLRELTELEQPVMRRVMEQIIERLPDAWNQMAEVEPRFQRLEVNPHFTQLVPPRDMVVVVRLEMSLQMASGRLHLCLPFDMIEPLVPKLSAHYLFIRGKKEASAEEARALRERIGRLVVPVTVILGTANVSFAELLDLEVGDYITLDTRVDGVLPVRIGSRTKFYGRPGRVGNRMAVEIVKVAPSEEEE